MNQIVTEILPDPLTTPLDQIDVSDPRRFEQDNWQPLFARLRKESPVHYQADSPAGDFWSITKFNDIVEVERETDIFSSEPSIAILDPEPDMVLRMFIAMDRPEHDDQRRAVQGAVAPKNLQEFEKLIRTRTQAALDALPEGETFDWVSTISRNLTTQMLAALFDFPFEEIAVEDLIKVLKKLSKSSCGSDGGRIEELKALPLAILERIAVFFQYSGECGGVAGGSHPWVGEHDPQRGRVVCWGSQAHYCDVGPV